MGCFAKNPFTSVDVGPSCGNMNSAHVGDITKAGSCRLCNSKTDPKCCPETQIPWCYVGLAQTEEQETREETEKQETSEKDQKAIEEAYPGCAGVCRKPGSALCFAKNPFTSVDVGQSCGNMNS